ncbi:MAG: rhodanese-like domain-containing protein [Methanoregula sp.]
MKILTIALMLTTIALIISAGCTQSSAPASPAAQATSPGGVAATSPGKFTDISAVQAKDLIATEKDLVIIDVSPYYDQGHLPGAISIPLAMLDTKIPSLDKTKTFLVYCHGDAPSIAGAQKLVDAGFPRVYRLAGNYAAWVNAGYPVEK